VSINSLDPPRVGEQTSEYERLLQVAEHLHERVQDLLGKIQFFRLAQVILGLIVIIFATFLVVKGDIKSVTLRGWTYNDFVFLIAMTDLFAIAFIEYLARKTKLLMIPDTRALSELVELLRESESAIAKAQKWSTLEQAQFRIRLARFNIDTRHKEISSLYRSKAKRRSR
jgi:hypothetical protein